MTTLLKPRGRPSIDGLHLFIGAALAVGLHGLAAAQAGPVPVDESKVPEWVRRQATSPMKIIISSDPSRKQAPAKVAEPAPPPRPRPARVEAAPAAAASAPVVAAAAAVTPAVASPAMAAPAVAIPAAAPPAAPAIATMEPVALTPVDGASASAAASERVALVAPLPMPAPVVVVESELRLIKRVDPQLPRLVLEGLGTAASVDISFTVNTDGSVSNAKVVSSSHAPLNRPTLAAVNAWRFEPVSNAREQRVSFSFGGR